MSEVAPEPSPVLEEPPETTDTTDIKEELLTETVESPDAEVAIKDDVDAVAESGEDSVEKFDTSEDPVPVHKIEDGGDATGDDDAPNLVEANSSGDAKLIKDLDDEAPKTFPQVLMDILSNEEDSDTIAWMPHGRSFIIYKKKKFAAHVLPKYFKATKFTSFTRKLNRWGFTRVTRGPEMGSYYHKLFLRDDPSLCLRMSSHSSSKFQDTQQQLMPAPMPPLPFGMPMAFGMPGMQPMMPGGMPGMNPGDLSQQNQYINQQLQQLQWQQFQLQQLQQQQQHHAQQQGHNPHGPPMHPPPGHHPHMGHPQSGPHHMPPPHHQQPPPPGQAPSGPPMAPPGNMPPGSITPKREGV